MCIRDSINAEYMGEQNHIKEIKNLSKKYDALKQIKKQEGSAFAAGNRRLREQLQKLTTSLVADTSNTTPNETLVKEFDYGQLLREKETLRREVEAARDGYRECEKRIMELMSETKEAKSQCDAFRAKLKTKSSRVVELELDIESLNSYINELEKVNEQLTEHKQSLEEKILSMEKCNPEEQTKGKFEDFIVVSLPDDCISHNHQLVQHC
eukprot:TRINITY_DN8933_c0_g1_i1.p1 TRINITY_DN8933_c0_g1~~TRINITY_DN8933_c0_g1_i1.p1  ORF type:complete len:210 (-),score=62.78 TRINITY_DN8933_c0_g1_i1:179-808(-)